MSWDDALSSQPGMRGDLSLLVAFFLSGAAGLIFQIVWFHRAALVLGNGVWAVSIVLSSFMGGLAVGNFWAARSRWMRRSGVRAYATLEVATAALGLAVTLFLPAISHVVVPIARQFPDGFWALNGMRLLCAFVSLLLPASAMGATLPLLVGAARARGVPTGIALGRLFGWNTLGAVVGVLAAELLLIDRAGIFGAAISAAGLNVLAAAVVWFAVDRDAMKGPLAITTSTAEARTLAAPERRGTLVLVAAGLSGLSLLALEVLWFRFLALYVLSTTLATSLMLAVVLSGLALGGLWVSSLIRSRAPQTLAPVAFAAGTCVVASYWGFQFTSGTQVGEPWRIAMFALLLAGPTSFCSGALFTLLGDTLGRRWTAPEGATAWLVLVNTLGGMLGPPLAAFVLLPVLHLEQSLALLAAVYGAIGIVLLLDESRTVRRVSRSSWAGALVTAGALLFFPFGLMAARYVPRVASAYSTDGSAVVATREGPSESIFLLQQRIAGRVVYDRLVTNGFSMTGTAVPGMRYMRYFAYWPMLLHGGSLERALVICYGVGVTAGAVLQIPSLHSLDIVEISSDIVAMSEVVHPDGHDPLRDPRVRLHLEDGRFYLQTTDQQFDLITGEPPPPRTPGTVDIYTREYFELVRSKLRDGGIATYWLPVGRPDPGTDVDTIVRAFCDVFDDCSLWNATPFDLMLVGSRPNAAPAVSKERFVAPWQMPGLQASLREVGFERPEQIGATFLGDAPFLRQFVAHVPPLVDNYPQRLRPSPGRPSLSDPRYGRDAAATEHYRALLDPEAARQRFLQSAWIQRMWPQDLIEPSAQYFAAQRIVNEALWSSPQPLSRVQDLHALLTGTSLRTLPLWLLGTDDIRLAIAESSDDGRGTLEYARGLRGLSGRDYAGAANFFARAQAKGFTPNTSAALRALALHLAGRREEAQALAAAPLPWTPEEQRFWQWLREQ